MTKHAHVESDLAAEPILMPHKGRLAWLFPSGRIVPDVSGAADDDPEKKFTQADLDRLIDDRLKRERSKAPELPADYADLKKKADELDKLKAENVTAEEATRARIDALEKAVQEAKADGAAAKAAGLEEKRRSAVIAIASKNKAVDPDDVFALLPKDAVTIGDDGQVTGAEEAVKALLEAKPHLVGKPANPKPDPGQGKSGEAGKTFGEGGRAEAQKRGFIPVPAPAAAAAGQK